MTTDPGGPSEPPGPGRSAERSSTLDGASAPDLADSIDLRLVPVALALWLGALAGVALPRWVGLGLCALAVTAGVVSVAVGPANRRDRTAGRDPAVRRAVVVAAMCLLAGVAVGTARSSPVWNGPVSDLAAAGAHVQLDGVVARDPAIRQSGTPGDERGAAQYVVGRIRVDEVIGRGRAHEVRVPVLIVSGDLGWAGLLPGQRVRAEGRLEAIDEARPEVAAVFRPYGGPGETGPPSLASRATEPFRDGLRRSVDGVHRDARGLIPGLVIGDESLMPDDLREAMTVSGLTHLTAVSGTNITILLVVALGLARWCRVRGYVLPVVGTVCVAGFVLLARPEPSVVRAAAMGVVAVVGVALTGRRRGVPALSAAVCVLVLVDPWLARSVGFALSVLATAGILLLVPVWERALRWLPRPLALAVTVPLAAQVACTPVLLAVAGELSLAALPANMLAAPAVAPATVFGVAAAALSPVAMPVATALGWLASLPAWWIGVVARWFADQPGAVVPWPPGIGGVVVAVVLVILALVAVPMVLRRPVVSAAAGTVLVVGLLKAVPTPGWPPPGWLVVACDVGQGDALVLRAGERAAVVVDAGPEPRLVRRCLDALAVEQVPLLVLTHFHADHVSGVPGVLAGRAVGQVLVSPLDDPPANAAQVRHWLDAAGVPVRVAQAGERRRIGPALELEVLWPRRLITSAESASNNSSVVIAADVDGVGVLLTGDLEPAAQRALLGAEQGLTADVLKVAHHGSPHQDHDLLTGVGARLALISVGDNDYGHPARRVLDALRADGVGVYRTDEHGSIAVVRSERGGGLSGGLGGLGVVTGGPRVPASRGRGAERTDAAGRGPPGTSLRPAEGPHDEPRLRDQPVVRWAPRLSGPRGML